MPQARLRFEIAPDLNHQADMAPKLDPPMVLTSEPQHDKIEWAMEVDRSCISFRRKNPCAR